jgi:hypothetical protein
MKYYARLGMFQNVKISKPLLVHDFFGMILSFIGDGRPFSLGIPFLTKQVLLE